MMLKNIYEGEVISNSKKGVLGFWGLVVLATYTPPLDMEQDLVMARVLVLPGKCEGRVFVGGGGGVAEQLDLLTLG